MMKLSPAQQDMYDMLNHPDSCGRFEFFPWEKRTAMVLVRLGLAEQVGDFELRRGKKL